MINGLKKNGEKKVDNYRDSIQTIKIKKSQAADIDALMKSLSLNSRHEVVQVLLAAQATQTKTEGK